ARLRQVSGEQGVIGTRERTDLAGNVCTQILTQPLVRSDALLHGDERRYRLAPEPTRASDDSCFRDRWLIDQRALHFHRADTMTGDVQHVVDAAQDPEVAVLVALRAIAGKVDAVPARPV